MAHLSNKATSKHLSASIFLVSKGNNDMIIHKPKGGVS
jgi:hypothetical protein